MEIRRIRYLRDSLNLSQGTLADYIEVSQNKISLLEKGIRKISLGKLYKLTILLGYEGPATDLLDMITVKES